MKKDEMRGVYIIQEINEIWHTLKGRFMYNTEAWMGK
jgi:hypothetical protein